MEMRDNSPLNATYAPFGISFDIVIRNTFTGSDELPRPVVEQSQAQTNDAANGFLSNFRVDNCPGVIQGTKAQELYDTARPGLPYADLGKYFLRTGGLFVTVSQVFSLLITYTEPTVQAAGQLWGMWG
jgi:hypothetical protein